VFKKIKCKRVPFVRPDFVAFLLESFFFLLYKCGVGLEIILLLSLHILSRNFRTKSSLVFLEFKCVQYVDEWRGS